MMDYVKTMPAHSGEFVGEKDLYLEVFKAGIGKNPPKTPILFVHGAYSGSWMWCKYIPQFLEAGYDCYGMNLSSHYKSRSQDMTRLTFDDYLEDIRVVIASLRFKPILIGHSMGGLLGQKIAEEDLIEALVTIDSSVSREVNQLVPYPPVEPIPSEIVVPAPLREEHESVDESSEDILFQRKYLSMESAQAMRAFSFAYGTREGISVDSSRIKCPVLVVKAVNSETDERRGQEMATFLKGAYLSVKDATHTGVMVGQRTVEIVLSIIRWLDENDNKPR